ncbi:MAG TPA: carboxypeptidase regulatory-like domain-containing protein [Terriglobales bacterium]|nr:carboxypeptidase regulatory-like domain-containing protein [Terriglobales bacterium]
MQSVKCSLESFVGRRWAAVLASLILALVLAPALLAQSLLSGDITGTVTDPSGAIVPNAVVNLKSLDTGAAQTTNTNAAGFYRFTLLKPGRYQIAINQSGFEPVQSNVVVAVGQATTTNISLKVGGATQTVEVSAEAPVVNAESASVNTSFSQLEVSTLPNGGQDLTNIAQTTPGTVMNTSMGYGNFTNNGLPATSNLFTVNGENDMDPYFNINNSGATNLTLGANEIQEATVVTNPYSGQYGQLSGAQVSYLTKSGSNAFHGNVNYWWNGRALNANDWFANNDGVSRPFANNNQYAASFGGPIIKDKTFFFVDYEGLRYVLPTVQSTTIVTPGFAAASLAYIGTNQPAELPLYQKFYGLELNAPGAGSAVPLASGLVDPTDPTQGIDPGGCGTATPLPGYTGPCAATFTATPNAKSHEWILAGRVDQNIGQNDKAFLRYRMDRGLQATSTDPINSNFNAFSNQPAYDGQIQETHIFSPNATNQFVGALSHYSAIFTQNEAAVASTGLPISLAFAAPVQLTSFNPMPSFPQGRNVTQYQLIDDFTLDKGNHNLKFGVNFRRYDISDHNFFYNYPRAYFGYGVTSMTQLGEGLAYQYRARYNASSNVPIATYGVGFYGQDEWRATSNLKLTFALRLERNSNPVCQTNCLDNFVGPFGTFPTGTDVPYNSVIQTGLHQGFPGVDAILPSPRFGFVWSPWGHNHTVVSGGYGIFYDSAPAGLVDDLLANPPVAVDLRIRSTPASDGILAFDPGPNGAPAAFAASSAGFIAAFNGGGSYDSIKAAVPAFSAPSFTSIQGTVHSPRVQEWNLQIQQEVGANTVFLANYSGSHSTRIPYTNGLLGASDPFGYGGGFPAASPDAAFSTITQVQSGANAFYDGVNLTVKRNFSHNFSGGFNYTYGHDLDEVSNGGVFVYGNDSIEGQINPNCFRCNNYGNADYDIRHYISAYYLYQPGFKFGNSFLNQVLGGWQYSGKLFWRTGLPFTVDDGNVFYLNNPTAVPGQPLGGSATFGQISNCSSKNASDSGSAPPCLDVNSFNNVNSATFTGYTNFPTQRRNQYRGPGFFDMDMSLFKNFKLTERLTFGIGANAYNVFNHPNFANPDHTLGDVPFGDLTSTVSVPASPYGSFVGAAAAPRVLQLQGKIVF